MVCSLMQVLYIACLNQNVICNEEPKKIVC